MILFLFGVIFGLSFSFVCFLTDDFITAYKRKRDGNFWDIKKEDK